MYIKSTTIETYAFARTGNYLLVIMCSILPNFTSHIIARHGAQDTKVNRAMANVISRGQCNLV